MNLKTKKAIEQLEKFVSTPLEETLRQHEKTTHQEIATNLFKTVASTVPAYQSFLATHKINGETIQTLADFQKLPVICKENYISVYSLPELCEDGMLGGCDMIAASSGSTGKPTFWPRFLTSILAQLLRLNSEFANYVPREYQRPQVELKATGDREYFPTGVKHKYTRNL
ncbi:hypothetical protein [Cylindrospermopsis raciborskii]|uniref:hypothetical protein n=1 Tax=Cylindrospermopsis raciborskii TaxID=77022 RepID=UPI00387A68C9